MYIYGVLNSDKELFFGPHGVTACEEVYTVSYQNISVVVSDSETLDYTHMRKDRLAMLLVRHQKAIEKIMGLGHTIIPMRLGTFAKDEAEIKHILASGHSIIKDVFDKISNKIEIDVAATWSDFTSVLKETGDEKEIRELKERLLANPKQVSIDDQMKVGFMVKKALDEKRDRLAEEIQNVLKKIAREARAHEIMDDKLVMNSAFFIDKSDQTLFYKKVEELNMAFAERLNFRCVGPLPPYSFYTLEIKKMQIDEIDWAKKKLGVNDATSKDGIKKAYQRSAVSSHPDRNPDIPGSEMKFDEVNKAYKILVDYCEACEQMGQGDGKNAVLVKVRE